jgi:ABC-type lipopolysaccharide export system ATPase subunit
MSKRNEKSTIVAEGTPSLSQIQWRLDDCFFLFGSLDISAVEVVNVHIDNRARFKMPTVMGTVMMIEHVMKAIMGICNRIIVLHHGAKIAEGTPQEVANSKTVIEVYLGEQANA